MISPEALGQLRSAQELVYLLADSTGEETLRHRFHAELPPMAWCLGRGVWQEAHWLRTVIQGDDSALAPLGASFAGDDQAQLPPKAELLAWARRLQDDDIMLLANPGMLPEHPLMAGDRLVWWLVQEYGRLYENMLASLTQQAVDADDGHFPVVGPLVPQRPRWTTKEINRGHYRVGARAGEIKAYDNELPAQAVMLDAFRIARTVASNAHWLAFMEAGGYEDRQWWSEEGWSWLQASGANAPSHWRRNADGFWYGVGLKGPYELVADDPVSGINRHEALAFANWVASLGGDLAGACLPHEYQWEVALRSTALEDHGRVWEWTADVFHAYEGFDAFPDEATSAGLFDGQHFPLKGGCLHTRPQLKRDTLRRAARPEQRRLFAGVRLIFPPGEGFEL
jgi:iron(II)-dependent oxidoreductase